MATHRIDHSWNGGGASVAASVNYTANGETNRTVTVPEGTADVEVALPFLFADLKVLEIIPTGAVTVETNSASAADDVLQVGSFLSWAHDSGIPNPITADVTSLFLSDANAADTDAIHAAVTDNGSPQTITTAITQPLAAPRRITATAGGTSGDIKAIAVTVVGTDENGDAQSEVLPVFTVDTPGTVTSTLYFQTVTSFTIPAHDGTGATTAIGVASETAGDVTVEIRVLHDATP